MLKLRVEFTKGLPRSFNAQCSRVIIVIVQLGAVKIHVAAVEAFRKRG
jgi:hypothetical protein